MIGRLLNIYRVYFLISLLVSAVIILGNLSGGWVLFLMVVLAALLTPFIYELDYVLETYIIEPNSEYSISFKSLIKSKNFKGAFLYAHENKALSEASVFRSGLTTLASFAIAFLLIFSKTNIFASTLILTFLLTTLYQQVLSFYDNSWRKWYTGFFEFTPKEIYAKIFLGIQFLVFLYFLLQLF